MNQWMNLNELKSYQHLDQNGRVDLTRYQWKSEENAM